MSGCLILNVPGAYFRTLKFTILSKLVHRHKSSAKTGQALYDMLKNYATYFPLPY